MCKRKHLEWSAMFVFYVLSWKRVVYRRKHRGRYFAYTRTADGEGKGAALNLLERYIHGLTAYKG